MHYCLHYIDCTLYQIWRAPSSVLPLPSGFNQLNLTLCGCQKENWIHYKEKCAYGNNLNFLDIPSFQEFILREKISWDQHVQLRIFIVYHLAVLRFFQSRLSMKARKKSHGFLKYCGFFARRDQIASEPSNLFLSKLAEPSDILSYANAV